MTQRVTLYLESELHQEVVSSKPRALSMSTYCALLIEQAMSQKTEEDPNSSGLKALYEHLKAMDAKSIRRE